MGRAISQQDEAFTSGAQTGTVVDVSGEPMTEFSLQVWSTGGLPILYTVLLEVSLDNSHWDTMISYTNAAAALNVILTSNSAKGPVNYYRLRSTALTLLSTIAARVVAMQ